MVNLYGHFSNDAGEEDYERSVRQIDFLAAIGGTHFNCQAAMWKEAPLVRPTDAVQIEKYAQLSNCLGGIRKEQRHHVVLPPARADRRVCTIPDRSASH